MDFWEIPKLHAVLSPFIWLNDTSQIKSASWMVQKAIEQCQEVRNSMETGTIYLFSK